MFDRLAAEAVAAYDRIIGLDFGDCTVDGGQHKAPAGGEGTGRSPLDRGKRGWKWSLAADTNGIPVAWIADAPVLAAPAANRLVTVPEIVGDPGDLAAGPIRSSTPRRNSGG